MNVDRHASLVRADELHPSLAESPDADFERRWTAWMRAALAHDTVIRKRSIALGIVAAAIALAAAIAYGLILCDPGGHPFDSLVLSLSKDELAQDRRGSAPRGVTLSRWGGRRLSVPTRISVSWHWP